MFKTLTRQLRMLVDGYLLPRSCAVCGRLLHADEKVLCMPCLVGMPVCNQRDILLLNRHAALVNAAMPTGLVEAWMVYDPESPYGGLIRTAKYHSHPDMARELGRLFGRELLSRGYASGGLRPEDIDALLPMPMHWSKELRRGYNQSAEIAAGLAELTGAVVADNLVAVRPHRTQTRLSHSRRAANIKDCFELRHADELAGLHVAIVDDIITTGASVEEAVMTLSRSKPGVASVSVLALGATKRKG